MKIKKSIVLVIVEGQSENEALYPWLRKMGKAFDVQFEIQYGDVFTRKENQRKSSKDIIGAILAEFKKRRKVDDSDILAVFHLTDTDGVFIPDEYIIIDSTLKENLKYTAEEIIVPNKSSLNLIQHRNEMKRRHLTALSRVENLRKSIYGIYYFSRNLDAIIHDRSDLLDDAKVSKADNFSNSFQDELEFEAFFNNQVFTVAGDEKDSWDFIVQNCNSLKRYSNFHLLLEKLRTLLTEYRRKTS